jgi:outer membrane immunogenic protein
MRVLLGSIAAVAMITSATAADLPVKAPPPAPVMAPVWNWSGFYIGVNGGYSWGRSSRDLNFFNPLNGVTLTTGTGGGRDLDGGVFGGQLGYNWQTGNWILGIETDAQWTGQKGSTTVLCPVAGCFPGRGTAAALSDELEWFGTFRGRGGVLVTPSFLLYVTGGLAYGSLQTEVGLSGFTATGIPVTAVSRRGAATNSAGRSAAASRRCSTTIGAPRSNTSIWISARSAIRWFSRPPPDSRSAQTSPVV